MSEPVIDEQYRDEVENTPVALITLSIIAGILSIIVIIIAIMFYFKQEKIIGRTFQSPDLAKKYTKSVHSRKKTKPSKKQRDSKLPHQKSKKVPISENVSNFKVLEGFPKSSDIDWNSFASTKKTTHTLSPTPSGGTSSLSPSASPRISSSAVTTSGNLMKAKTATVAVPPAVKKVDVMKKNKFERKSAEIFIDTSGNEGGVAASLMLTQSCYHIKGKKNDP